ncbi:TetR/AcrR family transcriptional regulator [Aeromicrobium sp. CF3.5]|uniref:TetR/AcrR family transcriptional regulator n=1 Tax=Aeromicrobium sp. CF3.5 TaxID=3373078 RepID=UPI003EE4B100
MGFDKSAETRQLLVDTALRLFRTDGYQATTMRRIASEAGVSPGHAYYYFTGKDELVHELYLTIQHDHRERTLPCLVAGAPLATNLRVVLDCGLDVMEPYHAFGSAFVQNALPSTSTASPFSAESGDARAMAIALMGVVVERSAVRAPRNVLDQLPTVLWLVYLGVTLHWVTDSSRDHHRSRILATGVSSLVSRAVALSRVPGASGLITDATHLLTRLTPPPEERTP